MRKESFFLDLNELQPIKLEGGNLLNDLQAPKNQIGQLEIAHQKPKELPHCFKSMGKINEMIVDANNRRQNRSRRNTIDFKDLSNGSDSENQMPIPRSTCIDPNPVSEILGDQMRESNSIAHEASSEDYIDIRMKCLSSGRKKKDGQNISFDLN